MDEYIVEIIKLAKESFDNDEVPVGAIVVKNNKIIGRGINTKENGHIVSGHAEINALNEASLFLNDWRLDDCDLYVTLKPCAMCCGAILEARINRVYYLCDKTYDYIKNTTFYEEKINNSELYNEYVKLLKKFFENKRK